MWTVKWNNIITGRFSEGQKFATQQEAQDWVNAMVEKEAWGKGVRYYIKDKDEYPQELYDSEEILNDPEFGEYTLVKTKPEYAYEILQIDEMGVSSDSKRLRMEKALSMAEAWKPHLEFGQLVKLYFIGLINLRGFTGAQKEELMSSSNIRNIIMQLDFGRIQKAKNLIDQMSADNQTFFADDLLKVKTLMNDWLEENA